MLLLRVFSFCDFRDLRWLVIDLGVSLGPWLLSGIRLDHLWQSGFLDFLMVAELRSDTADP